MKAIGSTILVGCAAFIYGCAGTAPSELVNARQAYKEASEGPAAQLAPAELHTAKMALASAEASYSKDSDSYQTLDLAYVAERRAQMAAAHASIAIAQGSKDDSDSDYQDIQGDRLTTATGELTEARTALELSKRDEQASAAKLSTEQAAHRASEQRTTEQREATAAVTQDLAQSRAALAASQQSGQAMSAELEAEQSARRAAEKKAADAKAELARVAAVTEDARGTVITLSGSVLFRSNEARLMPGAESRLDLVVDALSESSDRRVVVEGYTDSQGSEQHNEALSQRRAETVRDYLINRGYPAGLVQTRGMGEARPIADNATAEGRANNRRVEIILERAAGK